MEPLVLWPSAPRLLLGLAILLGACLLAIGGLVTEGPEVWSVVLLALTALSAAANVKLGLRRTPMLVLDDDGVSVYGTRLKWDNVERVRVARFGYRFTGRTRRVVFLAHDERPLLEQAPVWGRFVRGLSPRTPAGLSVVPWLLPVRRRELLDEVRSRYDGPVIDA